MQAQAPQQSQKDSKKYTCVTCQTPSSTLYKNYSPNNGTTKFSSIKLTRCTNCNNDVDPYIEYELLLVIMDCILFRKKAYRHLLFNRKITTTETKTFLDLCGSSNAQGSGLGQTQVLVQYIGIASLVEGYLKYKAFQQQNDIAAVMTTMTHPKLPMEKSMVITMKFVVISFFEHVALLVGVIITCRFILRAFTTCNTTSKTTQTTSNNNTNYDYVKDTLYKLYQSIFLPSFLFHLMTISIVSIWENTDIVRILGSVFILAIRLVATKTVLERSLFWLGRQGNEKVKDDMDGEGGRNEKNSGGLQQLTQSIIVPTLPLFVGMSFRCIIQPLVFFLCTRLTLSETTTMLMSWLKDSQQCSGLEMQHLFFLFGGEGEGWERIYGTTVCLI
mmetsp:Transcript_15726/g.20929  ORF Transcript_15726/g.20929 Transcript_15726/m.20929 type:complete len:387 (-) Transcript_15726:55-1215(-)